MRTYRYLSFLYQVQFIIVVVFFVPHATGKRFFLFSSQAFWFWFENTVGQYERSSPAPEAKDPNPIASLQFIDTLANASEYFFIVDIQLIGTKPQ
ncbi:MAG TPA: hypothetical protein PK022_09360 [Syntrophales bacterium]|nr:hypothetical protein [Syntrophales bacterium]